MDRLGSLLQGQYFQGGHLQTWAFILLLTSPLTKPPLALQTHIPCNAPGDRSFLLLSVGLVGFFFVAK